MKRIHLHVFSRFPPSTDLQCNRFFNNSQPAHLPSVRLTKGSILNAGKTEGKRWKGKGREKSPEPATSFCKIEALEGFIGSARQAPVSRSNMVVITSRSHRELPFWNRSCPLSLFLLPFSRPSIRLKDSRLQTTRVDLYFHRVCETSASKFFQYFITFHFEIYRSLPACLLHACTVR